MNIPQRRYLGQVLAGLAIAASPLLAHAEKHVVTLVAPPTSVAPTEPGFQLDGYFFTNNVTLNSTKLILNGAGVRKRGYFKTEAGAIYLTKKAHTLEDVFQTPGARRIHLVILKEITPDMASRYFLADFKLSTTPEEYASLLNEVGIMGEMYSTLKKLNPGDTIDLDWIPGVGFMPYLNGRAMLEKPFTNERFYKVVLRNYVGSGAPEDYRKAMLGITPPNVGTR